MERRILRDASIRMAAVLAAIVLLAGPSITTAADDPADTVVAIVTADDALIRSGPHGNYYPFGRIPSGQPVLVIAEKENWARVRTVGPAFRDFYGYIRHDSAEESPLIVSEDGRTARAASKVDILAPNMNSGGRPGDSWKLLVRVETDERLTVLQTIQHERSIVYKVALPRNATGWMNRAHLRDADPADRQRLMAVLTGTTEANARPAPQRPAPVTAAKPATTPTPVPKVLARVEDPVPSVTPAPVAEPLGPAPWPTIEEAPARPEPEARPAMTMRPEPVVAPRNLETAKPAPQPRETRTVSPALEDLERAYERLQNEPIETAEVMPLRNLYLELAQSSREKPGAARYAEARAEQLLIWSQLQEKRQEIDRIRQRLRETSSEAQAARVALEAGRNYVAVGTVAASTIYNGQRLPMLLRLQEPTTGRTIAYLRPDDHRDLLGLIGQLIGIVGTRTYDGALRLNVIEPDRVDILTSGYSNQ